MKSNDNIEKVEATIKETIMSYVRAFGATQSSFERLSSDNDRYLREIMRAGLESKKLYVSYLFRNSYFNAFAKGYVSSAMDFHKAAA
jgi:hypothetical protein